MRSHPYLVPIAIVAILVGGAWPGVEAAWKQIPEGTGFWVSSGYMVVISILGIACTCIFVSLVVWLIWFVFYFVERLQRNQRN